ncbi:MAG TPA: PASTA domain-containing protein [Proteobacteria bacterium]|nr:PASTA domain-containing protein [Pseudomonadota bacterium]
MDDPMRKRGDRGSSWTDGVRGRIRFLGILIPLLLLLPMLKAFYLQILHGEVLRERAIRQNRMTVSINPRRGAILDRNGQRLAVSVPVSSVYAFRGDITDKGLEAQLLGKAVDVDGGHLLARMKTGSGFVWLVRKISPEKAEKVRALDLPGMGIQKESRRYYPSLDLAGPVLGFVGTDRGLEGLEDSLDDQLKGAGGVRVLKRDAMGRIYSPDDSWNLKPTMGSTVHLTLDRTIQYFTEEALNAGAAGASAKGAAAIVIESATGKILAMASFPGFNPNEFQRFSSANYRNRAINFTYEPGSTFKIITVSAALEEKVFDDMDILFCENGKFEIGNIFIKDHVPHGWLTLKGIVQKSSNIGASKIGLKLGRTRLADYAVRFGFKSRVGLLLPGERKGVMRDAATWRQVDTANASFGQGIAVTPLQMVNAINVIATGGRLLRPFLVENIVNSSGQSVLKNRPEIIRQVISESTAKKMTGMMESVVRLGGSGVRAAIPGYKVAGKTGTAQKFSSREGRYSEDAYVASFVGFAPADKPVITVIVVVDEPQTDIYGGVVAAPIWARIVGKTLEYLKVEPAVPEKDRKYPPIPEGTKLARADHEVDASGSPAMPDLQGLTLREALQVLSGLNSGIDVSGTGVVIRQDPAPGENVGQKIRLSLMPRIKT